MQIGRSVVLVPLVLAVLSAAPLRAAVADSIVPVTPTSVILESGGDEILLAVQAVDSSNTPIPNPQVNWQGPSSPPMATLELGDDPANTEAGYSYVYLRYPAGNGTYQVTATYGASSVVFTIENRGFGVARLEVTGGIDQSAVIGAPFIEPLTVIAVDAFGRRMSGQLITFSSSGNASTAGATFASASASTTMLTDAIGVASVSANANLVAGLHQVSISTPGASGLIAASLRLSNLAEAPATLEYLRGTPQQAPINTAFAGDLAVRVLNAGGQAMANVAVEVVGPLQGAGFSEVLFRSALGNFVPGIPVPDGGRAFTNASGQISASLTANSELGSWTAEARVLGGASPVFFSLTNTAAEAAYILGNGQQAVVGEVAKPGARFTDIAFLVQDSNRNPVGEGIAVTLTPPASGPSVTLDETQLFTDANGWVYTQGTANLIAGTYYVQAAVGSVKGYLLLHNRPDGYVVGEQLADPLGADQTGQTRTLRSLLTGSSYLLLDVCTMWCGPCNQAQPEAVAARAQLLGMGIPFAFVPLLVDGITPNVPSTQSDALAWRARYQIPDPVLHVSGQTHSAFWEAGNFVLGVDQPAFPSYLLVGPDGTILERFVGGRLAADLVSTVLAHLPELRVADVSVNESDGSATLTVTRSRTGGASTVTFTTVVGTAGANDFSARSGVLSFAASQSSATVVVPIVNDAIDEPGEMFSLSLSNATGAIIADGIGVITIADDDPAPALTIDDFRGAEGTGTNTPFTIPIHLDRPSAFSIVGSYAIVAGTASSKDVVMTSGKFAISPGQTTANVIASVIADSLVEAKETFGVVIQSATNATIADGQSVVSIVDDDRDTASPVVESKADVVVEVKMSSTATVVVSFTNPSAVDKVDGTLPTTCSPPSGSRFPYGRTTVDCVAEDRAGNIGSTAFGVVVRLPTVSGAVFAFRDPQGAPLTQVSRRQDVEVRVNAGAFTPRAKVQLTFIDTTGRAYDLRMGKAEDDGSLWLRAEIPGHVALGAGQMLAQSHRRNGDEYDRAWALMVVPR